LGKEELSGEESRYLAIAGPVGVGKTTLARDLARRWGVRLLLEPVRANPFLVLASEHPGRYALVSQLYFLLERWRRQHRSVCRPGLTISDYIADKDLLFARINLSPEELRLYQRVRRRLAPSLRGPDRVVYLTAPVSMLVSRLSNRGRPYERQMDEAFMARLSQSYERFFRHYRAAPVLRIDAAQYNLRDRAGTDRLAQEIAPFIGLRGSGA